MPVSAAGRTAGSAARGGVAASAWRCAGSRPVPFSPPAGRTAIILLFVNSPPK